MIIIDIFIKDEDLLRRINESEDFWRTGYRWYEGWWNEGINDLHHELIQAIWGENSPHEGVQIEGFEHWVGDYTKKESFDVIGMNWSLKPHFDKDEDKWNEEGKFVTPIIGTVFYPDPEGGCTLEVDDRGSHRRPAAGFHGPMRHAKDTGRPENRSGNPLPHRLQA